MQWHASGYSSSYTLNAFSQVDKETSTEESVNENAPVRPKDRGSWSSRQRPFVRNSMIVRSQTFSPGERNQYICRVRGKTLGMKSY